MTSKSLALGASTLAVLALIGCAQQPATNTTGAEVKTSTATLTINPSQETTSTSNASLNIMAPSSSMQNGETSKMMMSGEVMTDKDMVDSKDLMTR